jgi:hypothetical protein
MDVAEYMYGYYPNIMGHGRYSYPMQGAALVYSAYSGSGYDCLFYSTDDFWMGQTFERTDYKTKFRVSSQNLPPWVIAPSVVSFYPGEEGDLPIQLRDQGSDDIYCTLDWGDGSTPEPISAFYNNDVSPEPVYLPNHTALSGEAPFTVEDPGYAHTYYVSGKYNVNITLWDDDMWAHKEPGVEFTVVAHVLSPYEIKEKAVELLESILPGRTDWIGYDTLTLKYLSSEEDTTILVYNHIAQPPFYYETRLLVTFCDVEYGDDLFINASFLPEGKFGTKLILKMYNETRGLIDQTEIGTVYTCLEPIKIGQTYGPYEVVDFTRLKGTTYHHYSKFALRTEDALDHILRSINKDPRRGYGSWHEYWAWWCGFTYTRGLWVDEMHLDPQFGLVVFCEERAAVLNLMEVLKNCLNPQGVKDLTFKYQGAEKVDVEIYTLSDWWFGGWNWFDAAYDLLPGESFTIDGSSLSGGKLTDRIMMRVYDVSSGKLLDTIYVRTSGEWFLEVEPGNIYGDFLITDSTLILGGDAEWDTWWGGDMNWWDWFFGFWYWEEENYRCGWEVDECYDPVAANEEKARICSNLTLIKQVINMLEKADEMLVVIALMDAQSTTVMNSSYQDEYDYHLSWAKRYGFRANDNANKGRPHRSINDYKSAWKHCILAMKWALRNPSDPEPGSDMEDPCSEACAKGECEPGATGPWWMHWYAKYVGCCNRCHFKSSQC